MRVPGRGLAVLAVTCAFTSGCCTSRLRAAEIDAELRQSNIARAEPAMRKAAQQEGATLLPQLPLNFGLTPLCDAGQNRAGQRSYCVLDSGFPRLLTAGADTVSEVLDPEGKRHFAVSIGRDEVWARLARRQKSLFVLIPKITLHPIGHRSQCECNAGPVIESMSGYVNLGAAFLVDDEPADDIREISVPVVEDDIEWQCKLLLVQSDHVPRSAVACATAQTRAR